VPVPIEYDWARFNEGFRAMWNLDVNKLVTRYRRSFLGSEEFARFGEE